MFENLWFIVKQVFSVFSLAITSSYAVCLISNYPFYNPKLTQKQLIDNLLDSSFNLSIIATEVILFASLYYPYLDSENHGLIRTFSNVIEYSFWIELFYYSYHRFLHISNWYSIIHAKHHTNLIVYPLDTLDISILDSTGMILTLVAPLWFVDVNLAEHNFIMYIYLTGSFLSHSKLLSSRHVNHHKKFKCNFSFLFPIFDYACGTLDTRVE